MESKMKETAKFTGISLGVKLIAAIFFIGLITGCSAGVHKQSIDKKDVPIIENMAWEDLLGKTKDEVVSILGAPDAEDKEKKEMYYGVYYHEGDNYSSWLKIVLWDDNTVTMVSCSGDNHSAQGVKNGDSLEHVKTVFSSLPNALLEREDVDSGSLSAIFYSIGSKSYQFLYDDQDLVHRFAISKIHHWDSEGNEIVLNDQDTQAQSQGESPQQNEPQQEQQTTQPEGSKEAEDETTSDDTTEETVQSHVQTIFMEELNIPWKVTKEVGNGLIAFQDPETELWGYCDYDGKVVIDAKYNWVNAFSKGYACVSLDGTMDYSFIDKTGKIIYSYDPRTVTAKIPFSDDKDYACFIDGPKYYVVDKNGNIAFEYDYRMYDIDENFNAYAHVSDDITSTSYLGYLSTLVFDKTDKYGVFNWVDDKSKFGQLTIKNSDMKVVTDGAALQKVIPEANSIGITDDYIAVSKVKSNGGGNLDYEIKTGLLDYNLNTIIDFGTYRFISPIDKDHIVVITDDLQFGMVDSKGSFLIQPSENMLQLMPTEPDYSHTLLGDTDNYFFKPQNGRDVFKSLYTTKVVNKSGRNLILIRNVNDDHAKTTYDVYDLDKNKIVGKIPLVSQAAESPLTYILPQFVLLSDPYQCYDLQGNIMSNGALPAEFWGIEEMAVDGPTVFRMVQGQTNRYIMAVER